MSIEICVFSTRALESIHDWQEAIDELAFDLRLDAGDGSFHALNGFLPATMNGRPTGFECYHDDADDRAAVHRDHGLAGDWTHALSFRWGGNFDEAIAASMAAAAYAAATDGVIADGEARKVYNPQEALDVVAELQRERPRMEKIVQDAIERMKLGKG